MRFSIKGERVMLFLTIFLPPLSVHVFDWKANGAVSQIFSRE